MRKLFKNNPAVYIVLFWLAVVFLPPLKFLLANPTRAFLVALDIIILSFSLTFVVEILFDK